MNTISSLFKWIGDLIGANPNTLTTTSKTLIGAINEVDADVATKVPTTRTVNSKALSSDISLTASDVSAVAKSGDTMTGDLVVAASDTTQRSVGARNSNGTVYLVVDGNGKNGLYSGVLSKWLMYGASDGKVYLNNIPFDTQAQTLTALGKNWYFTRIGRVVYIDAPNDTSANVSAGNNTIGTLNEGLRPVFAQHLKCTNVHADIRLVINSNGTVQLYSASAWTGSHNCAFSGYCYLASA